VGEDPLTGAAIDLDYRAVDRVLPAMERRAKLLGLDAPAKSRVRGKADPDPPWVVVHSREDPPDDATLDDLLARLGYVKADGPRLPNPTPPTPSG
jgi:hypothetical protein